MLKQIILPLLIIMFTLTSCDQTSPNNLSLTPASGNEVVPTMTTGDQTIPLNSSPTPTSDVEGMSTMTNDDQSPALISSPTPTSGIEGMITEGPMCPGPVQVGNNSCPDKPFQASIAVLTAENTQVAQIQSAVDGYFKIALTPGTYILHPISGKPYPRAGDQFVVVEPGKYTQVTILFDTGMR